MNTNEWNPWPGGPCPVAAETPVCVRLRDGAAVSDRLAGTLFWNHLAARTDIVAWHLAEAETVKAPDLLTAAAQHMRDRAAAYDKPGGERSMAATVAAFNAITSRDLTESEGWLLMLTLKLVRDRATATGHADSQEDAIAYGALMGEARRAGL